MQCVVEIGIEHFQKDGSRRRRTAVQKRVLLIELKAQLSTRTLKLKLLNFVFVKSIIIKSIIEEINKKNK